MENKKIYFSLASEKKQSGKTDTNITIRRKTEKLQTKKSISSQKYN